MLLPALNLWCGVALATLMLTPLVPAGKPSVVPEDRFESAMVSSSRMAPLMRSSKKRLP